MSGSFATLGDVQVFKWEAYEWMTLRGTFFKSLQVDNKDYWKSPNLWEYLVLWLRKESSASRVFAPLVSSPGVVHSFENVIEIECWAIGDLSFLRQLQRDIKKMMKRLPLKFAHLTLALLVHLAREYFCDYRRLSHFKVGLVFIRLYRCLCEMQLFTIYFKLWIIVLGISTSKLGGLLLILFKSSWRASTMNLIIS